jgi:hypothetical protein
MISKLAGPNHAVSRRKLHIFFNLLLSFLDCAAKITAADAELDGNEPLHALVINPGRSGIQCDHCQLAQRYIGVAAAASRIGHFDVADFVDAVTVFRRIANHEIELPVALQDRSCGRSAHGGLND